MDKKSFLRGFGVGVLFTAAILGISCLIRTSDSSVIRRAEALGMSYENQQETLFEDASPSSGASVQSTQKASEAKSKNTPSATMAAAQPTAEGNQKEEDKTKGQDADSQSEKSKDNSLEEAKKEMKQDFETAKKEFTIDTGDWSSKVSQNLEELGIIDKATDFDAYLEKNGFSSQLQAGDYQISKDASFEEIARMITSD